MRALRRNKVEIALVKEIWQITRYNVFVEGNNSICNYVRSIAFEANQEASKYIDI